MFRLGILGDFEMPELQGEEGEDRRLKSRGGGALGLHARSSFHGRLALVRLLCLFWFL